MVAKLQTSRFHVDDQTEPGAKTEQSATPQLYSSLAELPLVNFNSRFSGKILEGKQLMVVCSEVQAGFTVPEHKHKNEQVTIIQSGAWHFNVGGREFIARAGDIVYVPAEWEHSAVAMENSSILEIFTPPRRDWSDDMDDYLWGI